MSERIRELVEAMFESLNLADLDSSETEQMTRYVSLLLKGLDKLRLTGEKSAEGIISQQIYDSLYLLKLTELEAGIKAIDLGSGGGLPGVPLKICRPEIEIYLMDSNRKKAAFLNDVIEKLELGKAHILCDRAEKYGQDGLHREGYDLVLSKAVGETAVLAELALPLLKPGGRALLYKGPQGKKEAEDAEQAFKTCGGALTEEWVYILEDGGKRLLHEIKKYNSTPPKYPRRAGVPARKPIR